ncbi:sensor histidine kinase [Actinomadura oligospora]|uniref:sensor histidine kinase n=1 Tax=Actinomadura oligospora TaxID=111804 RepID=UPI00047C746A|nr:HAMP domain-containing sensor histidine kinase [Actinomadura oligospora]
MKPTIRMRATIRARLALLYGGMFVAAGIVLLTLTYVLVQNSLQGPRGQLVNQVVMSSQALDGTPMPGGTPDPLRLLQAPTGRTPDPLALMQSPVVTAKTRNQPKGPVRVGGGPLTAIGTVGPKDGTSVKAAYLIQRQRVGGAADDFQKATLDSVLTQGAIALGLVALAALGLGWLMADRALRPVQRITETARRVARSHDLTERIGYDGPRDEVRELADTFDTMLGRLSRSFDGQRRFVANASHELRTPLAINRTLVDVAVRRRGASEDVRRLGESLLVVNERHERLIDGLLTLAGGENEVTERIPLDLADVARHVVDLAAAENGEAADRDVTVRGEFAPAPTAGDPVLLERLVQNLVENAVRHNHRGGTCRVMTGVHDGWTELTVTNTGPVVPAYETETIFEPFRRLGAERVRSDRGSGLGLSIVRAVAGAHGGTAVASPNPGGGLRVTVRLPNSGQK